MSLANHGKLVVGIYFEPPLQTSARPKEESGHIAVVRPSGKSLALIDGEDPDEIQAGTYNHRLVALSDGFHSHKTAWATGVIEYFWHDANPP